MKSFLLILLGCLANVALAQQPLEGFEYGNAAAPTGNEWQSPVMIVSDQFEGPNRVNVTAMTNVLDMLIAKQTISRISFGLNVLQTVLQVAAKSDEKEEKAESSQGSE